MTTPEADRFVEAARRAITIFTDLVLVIEHSQAGQVQMDALKAHLDAAKAVAMDLAAQLSLSDEEQCRRRGGERRE